MENDNQNSFQTASDDAQLVDSSDMIAELQRDALDNFSEIETITLSRLDTEKDVYYATILLKGKDTTELRSAISNRLMIRFVDRLHALLLPVFLDSKEPDERKGDVSSRRLFDPWSGHELAVGRFGRLTESPDYPISIRRWCLSTIRGYIAALDSVLAAESIPSEIALTACLEMLRNVLGLLFASKGGVFSHDSDAIVFFRDQFKNADSCFSQSDLLLYFRVLALKQRSLFSDSKLNRNRRREFESLLDPLADFFKRFERYIKITYTTESEKRFRKRLAIGTSVGGLSIIVVTLIVYLAVSFFTAKKPGQFDKENSGGIVGEYYKGENFDVRVLSRVDTQIDFSSKGSLDPRLPKDNFSARWKGFINIESDGKQRLCLDHDDGCRLFFNDKPVIDDWDRGSTRRSCASIDAKKGWNRIKIEYFESAGKAELRLLQGPDEDDVDDVKGSHLCCRE